MFNAEILTDAGQYTVLVPVEYKEAIQAWKYVIDTIKSGMPFNSVLLINGDDVEQVGGLLAVGDDAKIKHIRVYDPTKDNSSAISELMSDIRAEMENQQLTAKKPSLSVFTTALCTFLGQQMKVIGARYSLEGYDFLLPVNLLTPDIKQQAPQVSIFEFMSTENVIKFMTYWQDSEGVTPDKYTIVVPKYTITTVAEALDYLKDYVEETQQALLNKSENKDAKAWKGWRKDG